ncbi:MAG: sulfur carrier protein ThiS [Opitutales bacterium]|nr:sulfur carrier protein ThiS [Opitutales bacterium]
MIQIIANGEHHSVEAETPLPTFVESVGLTLDKVVVEHNGQALTRAEAKTIQLQEGDRLEIVRIVAGG